MQTLMGALVVVVLFLAVKGTLSNGKERWEAFALGAILLLGFSALIFFSLGWLIAPVALIFLWLSLWRLLHRQNNIMHPITTENRSLYY